MQKNVASQKWVVFAFDRTDNTPKTGDAAQITAKIAIDGAAANATNDVNPTEIEDGYYAFDLTQAETNGDILHLLPESSTGDVQVIGVPGVIFTVPASFADDVVQTGDTYALANGATGFGAIDSALTVIDTNVDAILVDTGTTIPAVLGTPAGVDFAADIAAIKSDTGSILTDTGSTIPGILGSPAGATMSADIAAVKADTAAIVVDTNELQGDWTNGGRLDLILDELTTQGDTNETAIAALNDISAADVNTQVDAAWTTQMADSVSTDGTIATREQALYMVLQALTEFSISGTTITVKKVDGSTTLFTGTLDDGTNPTSLTRAT